MVFSPSKSQLSGVKIRLIDMESFASLPVCFNGEGRRDVTTCLGMPHLREKILCHFQCSCHNPLWKCHDLLSGKAGYISSFPTTFPFTDLKFLSSSPIPHPCYNTTQAELIIVDLHVCSRAVWEKMKQSSQWLSLQSFTHLTQRAPLWVPDTASKQMQAF